MSGLGEVAFYRVAEVSRGRGEHYGGLQRGALALASTLICLRGRRAPRVCKRRINDETAASHSLAGLPTCAGAGREPFG